MLLTINKTLTLCLVPPAVEGSRFATRRQLAFPSNGGGFEANSFRDQVWIGVKAGDGECEHRRSMSGFESPEKLA